VTVLQSGELFAVTVVRSCFKTLDQFTGKAQADEKAEHIQYM
jgi:hypothetical protein